MAIRLLSGAIVAALWTAAAYTRADPDLWGHLRFGLDILGTWTIPTVDPYSFTQDRAWVNHEWLSEVAMGAAWTAGGTAGLAMLKGTLVLAALWLAWTALQAGDFAVRLGVMAAVVVGTLHISATLRPQVWSLAGMALLVTALSRGRGPWWLLPVLFALWANLHGGWIVGIGVLALWSTGAVWERPPEWPRWSALVLASLVATLVNPYGWGLWAFLIETVRVSRPQIEEWQPLWALAPIKWIPWLAITGAAVWLLMSAPTRSWPRILVLAALAYGSLRVVRILPLYAIVAAIALAPALVSRWPARTSLQRLVTSSQDRMVAVVLAAVGLILAVGVGSRSLTCITSDLPRMPEPQPAAALADARAGSRLVTYFNWGEYALWHLGPDVKVSMDGRRETVYSDARLAEHDAILYGEDEGLRLLAVWQPEYVWLPGQSRATRDWLAANGYRIEMDTDESFVAVRADLPLLNFTRQTSDFSLPRCFPR